MWNDKDLALDAYRVLQAFPVPDVGAQVSGRQLLDHFLGQERSSSDCVRGIRQAVHVGWVQLRPENQVTLHQKGLEALLEPPEELSSVRQDHDCHTR